MMKLVANNKKAYYDYFVEDKMEAGVVLSGTEVKSCRAGKLSIKESYVEIKDGEMFVRGMNISPYEFGNINNLDPLRKRKLLLHKSEIKRLEKKKAQDGYTLVPLKAYFNKDGRFKMEIGVCKGKKNYDKRDSIAKKESDRRLQRYK